MTNSYSNLCSDIRDGISLQVQVIRLQSTRRLRNISHNKNSLYFCFTANSSFERCLIFAHESCGMMNVRFLGKSIHRNYFSLFIIVFLLVNNCSVKVHYADLHMDRFSPVQRMKRENRFQNFRRVPRKLSILILNYLEANENSESVSLCLTRW